MFWPDKVLKITEGTSLDIETVEKDTAAMREDFNDIEKVMKRHPTRFAEVSPAMDFEAFRVAASWVSSRAFYVDAFHGVSSWIPALSHQEPVHVTSDNNACIECFLYAAAQVSFVSILG